MEIAITKLFEKEIKDKPNAEKCKEIKRIL
jgi:hypothetical protein